MASGFNEYLFDNEFLKVDFSSDEVTFTCPLCDKKQTHKLTVKFFLNEDEINCPCGGVQIVTYFSHFSITIFD